MSMTTGGLDAESGKALGAGLKGAGGGEGDGALNELFKVNQVYYRMLPTLSLVSKRTLLVNSPNKSSYQGISDTITFIFNSGEFYVSGPTSYLYIQVGYNNPAAYGGAKALLSQGNAMALFEDITFTSASGTELCRELNKGLHESYTYRYNNSQEYIDTVGEVQGAPTGSYSAIHDGVAPIWKTPVRTVDQTNLDATFPQLGGAEGLSLPRSGAAAISSFGYGCINLNVWPKTVTPATGVNNYAVPPTMQLLSFCIPLDQILGLFKPYMNTLIPSGIMAGGRLDLRLKDPTESLQFTAPAVAVALAGPSVADANLAALVTARQSALTVTRIYMVLDAYQMQDNVLKRLNTVQAGPDGMTYLFDSYDTVSNLTQGTGTAEFNIALARSRIVRSWNVVRDSGNVINPYINSFCAEAAVYRPCGKIQAGAGVSTLNAPVGVTVGGARIDMLGGVGGVLPLVLNTTAVSVIPDTVTNPTAMQYKYLQLAPPLPQDFDYTAIAGLSFPNQELVSSYQAVLGSLYFPQQPLNTVSEYYQNAQYIMSKCFPDSTTSNCVSFQDFKGGLGRNAWNAGVPATPKDPTLASSYNNMVSPYGMAIYGMLAEKSQILELSGLPVSNARLLKHKFIFPFPTQSGYARRIDTFTQYTRALRVFLGGKVICRE